jgi:hypothetical protein
MSVAAQPEAASGRVSQKVYSAKKPSVTDASFQHGVEQLLSTELVDMILHEDNAFDVDETAGTFFFRSAWGRTGFKPNPAELDLTKLPNPCRDMVRYWETYSVLTKVDPFNPFHRPGMATLFPISAWEWIECRTKRAAELFGWSVDDGVQLQDDMINAVYWFGACLPAGGEVTPRDIRRIVRQLVYKRRYGDLTRPPQSIIGLLMVPRGFVNDPVQTHACSSAPNAANRPELKSCDGSGGPGARKKCAARKKPAKDSPKGGTSRKELGKSYRRR